MKTKKSTKLIAVVAAVCMVFLQSVPVGHAGRPSSGPIGQGENSLRPTVSATEAPVAHRTPRTEAKPAVSETTDFLSGPAPLHKTGAAAVPTPDLKGADVVPAVTKPVTAVAKGFFSTLLSIFTGGMSTLMRPIAPVLQGVVHTVIGTLVSVVRPITGVIGSVLHNVVGMLVPIVKPIVVPVLQVLHAVIGAVTGVVVSVAKPAPSIPPALHTVPETLVEQIRKG